MPTANKYWKITVHDWGTLYAIGTEAQAEEWRKHKARWEQAVAKKEEVDATVSDEWEKLSDLLCE